MTECNKPPPPLLVQGVDEFDGGRYFECHETLEALWMAEPAATDPLAGRLKI